MSYKNNTYGLSNPSLITDKNTGSSLYVDPNNISYNLGSALAYFGLGALKRGFDERDAEKDKSEIESILGGGRKKKRKRSGGNGMLDPRLDAALTRDKNKQEFAYNHSPELYSDLFKDYKEYNPEGSGNADISDASKIPAQYISNSKQNDPMYWKTYLDKYKSDPNYESSMAQVRADKDELNKFSNNFDYTQLASFDRKAARNEINAMLDKRRRNDFQKQKLDSFIEHKLDIAEKDFNDKNTALALKAYNNAMANGNTNEAAMAFSYLQKFNPQISKGLEYSWNRLKDEQKFNTNLGRLDKTATAKLLANKNALMNLGVPESEANSIVVYGKGAANSAGSSVDGYTKDQISFFRVRYPYLAKEVREKGLNNLDRATQYEFKQARDGLVAAGMLPPIKELGADYMTQDEIKSAMQNDWDFVNNFTNKALHNKDENGNYVGTIDYNKIPETAEQLKMYGDEGYASEKADEIKKLYDNNEAEYKKNSLFGGLLR